MPACSPRRRAAAPPRRQILDRLGRHGAGAATGQAIQLVGVLTALVAGVLATRAARGVPGRR